MMPNNRLQRTANAAAEPERYTLKGETKIMENVNFSKPKKLKK